MKKTLTAVIMLMALHTAFAQNPFEQFGDKSNVLTMTHGRFNEFHDQDSVVQIGSILLDVNRKIIVGSVVEDTTEYMPSPTLISRWWAVDPLAEKYFSMSPYNFVLNNPVLFVDPNGDSVALHEVNQGGINGFKNIVSQGTGGFYQANVDPTTGLVTMAATGLDGKMTKEQQAFADQMTTLTTSNGVATINVANNSEDVAIGKIATNTMDVGDMQKLGTDGKVNAQKALVHEVNENYLTQVQGVNVTNAHLSSGNAENRLDRDGVVLNPLQRTMAPSGMPGVDALSVPITRPAGQGAVRIYFKNNNVLFVSPNNNRAVIQKIR